MRGEVGTGIVAGRRDTIFDILLLVHKAYMQPKAGYVKRKSWIYCLHFANQTGIDVSSAIHGKLAQNEVRFPVEFVPKSVGN